MIDKYIIFSYLLLLLVSGIYNKSNNNYKEYTSIGKLKNNKLLLVATIFASAVGGGTTFGLTAAVSDTNLSYVYALLLTIPIDILIAIFIVPRLLVHKGSITIGDIIEKDYGKVGAIISGISVILTSLGYMAAQIIVSSKIFQYILPINNLQATLASYFILITYTTIGGLRSVIFANLIQFIAMIIAIPVLTIIGLRMVGLEELFAYIPQSKYNLFNNTDLLADTISATTAFMFITLYPTLIQRILNSQCSKETTKAIINKSIIYGFFIICIAINGLIGYVLKHNFNDSHHLVINMVHYLLPEGIRGLILVGFLAATMSTADSDLNLTGITFVRDVWGKIFIIKNQKFMLLATQIVTVISGLFAIYLALTFNNIIDLIILAGAFWAPVILIPFIASLYGIKIKLWQFLFSSFISLTCTILNEVNNQPIYKLKGILIGSVISIILFSFFAWIEKRNNKIISL